MFLFSYTLACIIRIILLYAMLLELLFAYALFISFTLFMPIIPSHKSDMNNSCRIIFIKINIIKVNIIKIYTTSLVENVTLAEYLSKRVYYHLSIKHYGVFLIILLVRNQLKTNFNTGKRCTYVVINCFNTHFFIFVAVRNRLERMTTF